MNLLSKKHNTFLQRITTDYPSISFISTNKTRWDPKNKIIYFDPRGEHLIWSLLHELGHAVKDHSSYKLDIELVKMESEAWENAKAIGKQYKVFIDEDYLQDCLDSYREWIHKRSTCPFCNQTGIQANNLLYNCLNCSKTWQVSNSRFCRAYRRKISTY